ncbi:Arm DNA-binding domain-containing protein [Pectobacterium polaris]|nr:Arm DNA-binding domain-containing protein [Pectobacterium polaris]
MPLTDAKIRSTKPTSKPIKLADGGGLYLEVRPSGSKLWRYRYRIAGK